MREGALTVNAKAASRSPGVCRSCSYASRASRMPENCQRARAGRSCDTWLARGWPAWHTIRRAAHIVAHELAVVLAQRAGRRHIAGIRRVGARRPLPHFAIQVEQCSADHYRSSAGGNARFPRSCRAVGARRRVLPLGFGRQSGARPARESVGLEVADVAHRFVGAHGRRPAKVNCHQAPSCSTQYSGAAHFCSRDGRPAERQAKVGRGHIRRLRMNSRYSPAVTRRSPISNGFRKHVCRGRSLSKANARALVADLHDPAIVRDQPAVRLSGRCQHRPTSARRNRSR